MAKKKPYRKDEQKPSETNESPLANQETGIFSGIPRERIPLIILFFVVTIGSFVAWSLVGRKPMLEEYTFEVQGKYLHDMDSFTQGLVHKNGFLYESTGKRGFSKIRKINLKTGLPVKEVDLDSRYFGEGLAAVGDKLVQLTWQERTGFEWDLDLNKIGEFSYDFEGWGLTFDGKHLIASDGTSLLRFMDPETYEVVRKIYVRKGVARMPGINELEYINGTVYANVYGDDKIYMISPTDGKVTGRIDFSRIVPPNVRPRPWDFDTAILNGIAIHEQNGTLLVTGKNWPSLFEVKLKPIEMKK